MKKVKKKTQNFIVLGFFIVLSIFFVVTYIISSQNQSEFQKKLDYKYKPVEAAAKEPIWDINVFVDEFGDYTQDKYIYTSINGYFSNSATANSSLYVKVLFTKDAAGLFLHEYKMNSPAEEFSAKIKMKHSNGKVLKIDGFSGWSDKGGIIIEDGRLFKERKDFSRFRAFLENGGDIKVVVKDPHFSVYEFTIQADGFKEAYAKL